MTPIKSVLTQKRLSWYGYVMRRDDGNPTQRTAKMRWLDRLKSGINPEMATDRKRWVVMVKKVDTTQMVEDGNG